MDYIMEAKGIIEHNDQESSEDSATTDGSIENEQGSFNDTSSIKDGHILSWGCGEFGQHGHGHTDNVGPQESPMRCFYELVAKALGTGEGPVVERLKTYACGASHTVVVTDSDLVYAWGNGNSGQLGSGNKDTHLTPQLVRLPAEGKAAPIKGLACGSRHSFLWLENGLCLSWGNNFYAQLAYDFRVENYKDNQVLPHILRPITHLKVTQVACGEKHSLFLYDTGVVAACGCSSFGQLGSGNRAELVSPKALESPEGIASIACGANHSLAVTATGELYAWGLGRACGQRREDVLRPLRIRTCKSNVITVAGGSAHSVALTANGTVYTWGGGTEGQLGHGSKVLYLCEPLPLSHDALPRASQIACGDSYTAAITSKGTLYMWGKSSHVIALSQGKPDPSTQHPTPVRVSHWGRNPVASIACGSWHTVAVVGTPEWHPLEEDSEEEIDPKACESEDADSSEPMELDEGSDTIAGDAEGNYGSVCQKPQQIGSVDSRAVSSSKSTAPVHRETTKLTLAEFYAPTPLPTISPPEKCPEEMDSKQEQAILSTEEAPVEPLDYQRVGDNVFTSELEETQPTENLSLSSFFVDLGSTSAVERKLENAGGVKERPDSANRDTSTRNSLHQSRPRESNMVRSKTMPVVTRKPLKLVSASATTAFDWSEPLYPTDDAEPVRDRFMMPKSVSVQMNQKGNGSGGGVKGRKHIAHIGLQTSGEGDAPLGRPRERNIKAQPPKFNRAKTYYGRMNQKRPEAEPRLSKVLSSLPPAPSQSSSALTNLQPRRRPDKPAGPSDLSPFRGKQNVDLSPTVAQTKGRLPAKPVFSSASSWRMRHEKGEGL